jgi:predicted amidohydrolase
VKVAAVQHDIVWEDGPATCAHLEPLVATAAAAGARLVVLTEMFPTGFSMSPARIAETPGGPAEEWLRATAGRHGLWLCGSVAVLPAAGARSVNRFLLAAPDGTLHRYDKRHLFTPAGEHEHYSPGTATLTVDVEGLRVTAAVCYDLRFADQFWAAATDTDCFVVPANWPAARRSHWRALLTARAIENQAYVVGVNRIGEGGGVGYAGDSAVVDPWGETLAGGATAEVVLVAEVDPEVVRSARSRWPFLADR